MNLFMDLAATFSTIFEKPYRNVQILPYVKGTENIEKMYQIYLHVLMLADAVENEFGHLFFLVTADGCLQAFSGISYFMGLETGWTTPPHSGMSFYYIPLRTFSTGHFL
ncbi:hypothetical protein CEXT_477191 [Caerostris extrusa]|uniref:Uncharacterized protein n=1 Tax=Caerostris extrusa TaxID=172846 RepID=A0AAV4YDJ4_CAEEX|nr:hypothetical protein CEXT_477191 [Caerostris extrusa]